MRIFRFLAATFICCVAMQQAFPVLTLCLDHACTAVSPHDRVPADNSQPPMALETFEVDWERLDGEEIHLVVNTPPSHPSFAGIVEDTNCWGFDTSRQLLDSLHRLRL